MNDKLEFLKYITKKIFLEPVKLVGNLLHQLLYPRAWFYTLFIVYALKKLWVRDVSETTDKVMIVALIVLLLWKVYREWYDEWMFEQREDVKKRAREQTIEVMKGK